MVTFKHYSEYLGELNVDIGLSHFRMSRVPHPSVEEVRSFPIAEIERFDDWRTERQIFDRSCVSATLTSLCRYLNPKFPYSQEEVRQALMRERNSKDNIDEYIGLRTVERFFNEDLNESERGRFRLKLIDRVCSIDDITDTIARTKLPVYLCYMAKLASPTLADLVNSIPVSALRKMITGGESYGFPAYAHSGVVLGAGIMPDNLTYLLISNSWGGKSCLSPSAPSVDVIQAAQFCDMWKRLDAGGNNPRAIDYWENDIGRRMRSIIPPGRILALERT